MSVKPMPLELLWDGGLFDCILISERGLPENEKVNDQFWTTLGYNIDESQLFSSWRDTVVNEDVASLSDFLLSANTKAAFKFKHKDGHFVWLQFKKLAIDCNDSIASFFGLTDITELKERETELEKRVERFSNIVDGTDIGTWEWNVQTGETILNERWASIIGFSLKELGDFTNIETWSDRVHPEDLAYSDRLLDEHFAGKHSLYEVEVRMMHKDGYWVWVLDRGKVITWTPDGKPEWMTGSHQDITLRKLREERINKVNKRNRLFIEQAPTAIAMFDKDMRYMAVSQQWLKDYKLEENEIIGNSFYDYLKEDEQRWNDLLTECLAGKVIRGEEEPIRIDGSTQWINWEARPWYTNDVEVGGVLMYSADITITKNAKRALQEKQAFLETILNSIDVGVVSCDENGKLTLFNRATKEWHGLPPQPIPSTEFSSYYGLYHLDGETPLSTDEIPLLKALRGDEVKNEEIVIAPKDGPRRIVTSRGSQLIDDDGKLFGAVITMQDITERKTAEEKLRVSEESFKGAFEHAGTGMALSDQNGRWLKVNKALCEILGHTYKEFNTITFQDITHPDDLNKDLALLQDLVSGSISHYQIEKRYFHKDGHTIWALLSVSLVRDTSGNPLHFISQITDITAQKVSQQKLEETLAKFKGVIDASTQVSIIGTTTKGIITTFNRGAENLLGYSKEEMLLKRTPEVIHLRSEMDARSKELSQELGKPVSGFEVFVARAKTQQFEAREWTYVRKDGTTFPVLLTVTAVKENDTITGYLGIAADISEVKKAEREIKSLLAVTKDQNERLRNFAHIVSHNLRSHSGNFSMLLNLLVNDDPRFNKEKLVPMLVTASDNLKETITHLNEVVSLNSTVSENLIGINLHDAVVTAIENVQAVANGANTEIINEVSRGIKVKGVPAYIDSILLNFITNGIKYRSPNANSYVKISALVKNDFVKIAIQDNGLGIDLKRNGAKLFGMYKTFHGNKDARGIGLFITKNQIEAMNGRVEVQSEVNKGTTFNIYLKHEKN